MFHTLIEAVSGVNAPVLTGRFLTGMAVEIPSVLRRGGVYRFFNPPCGVLREIRGIESARALPGVLDIAVVKRPGEVVGELPNSLHRVGYVVTTGATRAEAIRVADDAEATVELVVEPQSACATKTP